MQLSNPLRPNSVTTTTIEDGAVTEPKTNFDTTPLSVEGGGTGSNNGSITGPGTLTFQSGAGSSDNINYICGNGANVSWTAQGLGQYMLVGFDPTNVAISSYTSPTVGSTTPLVFTNYGATVTNFTINPTGDVVARASVAGTYFNASDPATSIQFGGDGFATHAKLDEFGNYVASTSAGAGASWNVKDNTGSSAFSVKVDGSQEIVIPATISSYNGLALIGLGVPNITNNLSVSNVNTIQSVGSSSGVTGRTMWRCAYFVHLHVTTVNYGVEVYANTTYRGVSSINVFALNATETASGDYYYDGVMVSSVDQGATITFTFYPNGTGTGFIDVEAVVERLS